MGRMTRPALAVLVLLLALAGCKNSIVEVIGHVYDEAGGFDPRFTASADSFLVTSSVTFTNQTLADVRSIHWDFGDGNGADNVSAPIHTYAAKGIYTVTMTATSTHGTTRTFKMEVYALGTEPTVIVKTPAASAWVGNASAGHVTISVTVVDRFYTGDVSNKGVSSLTIKVNGAAVNTHALAAAETDASAAAGFTYSFDWNSAFVADGAATITAEATDKETETGFSTAVAVNVDNAVPVISAVQVPGASGFTASSSVSVNTTAADGAGSGVSQMQLSNDGTTWSAWETFSASRAAWALATGADGLRTVSVKVRDAVGNASVSSSGQVTLDTTAPSVALSINGGAAATGSASASLGITSSDAGSGTFQMRFSDNGGSSWSIPEAVAGTKSWTLAGGEGTKTVLVQVTDNVGNSGQAQDTIIYDATNPTAGTLVINSGAAWTNTALVGLSNSASDSGSGLYQMRFSDNGGSTWTTPVAYSTSGSFTLSSAQGSHTVLAEYSDLAGHTTQTSAVIGYDNVAPPAPTVSIDSGNLYATGTGVSLSINGGPDITSSVAQMQFSNDGSSWSSPETCAYPATKAWTLASGDGSKTVYVRVRDAAGNTSGNGTDSIVLDTTPPQVSSFAINSGAVSTNSTSVTLTSSVTDAGSGVSQMRFSNDNLNWPEGWVAYSGSRGWSLGSGDGTKTVWAQFKDNADRITSTSDTIALDTAAPVIISASFSPSTGLLKIGSTVRLNITTAASETGLTAGAILVNGVSVAGTLGGSGTSWHVDYTVAQGDMDQAQNSLPVSVVLRDAAGNNSFAWTTTPMPAPAVDAHVPVVTSASYTPSAGWRKTGDVVTLTISASGESGLAPGAVAVNSRPVTGFTDLGGGFYSAVYIVASGDNYCAPDNLPLSVSLMDAAGNVNAAYTTKPANTPGVDTAAPAGYSVSFDQPYVNDVNKSAIGFHFSSAEVGTIYNYSINSASWGQVTGGGVITSSSQMVGAIDLGGLGDGNLTLSATLTDPAGNVGSAATWNAIKDTVAPSGYTIAIDQSYANLTASNSMSFRFADAEWLSAYAWTVSSSGGGSPVQGSGTIDYPTQQVIGINVSSLLDGTLTFSAVLTDQAGNVGMASMDTVTKDTVGPTIMNASISGPTRDLMLVIFSEGVYGDMSATTALGSTSILQITDMMTPTTASILGVGHGAGAPSASYSLTWSPTLPTTGDQIEIRPGPIYDAAGNANMQPLFNTNIPP